ncbi:MAG: hypothetical protein HKN43_14465 [Rhodothermales bacterium]|nr:hypothetical protein [Rhodothermales bacterium]
MDKTISDSDLLDYIHDVLAPAKRVEVEIQLAVSQDLQNRLDFLVGTTSDLQDAVASVADAHDTIFLTDKIMRNIGRIPARAASFSLTEFLLGIKLAFKPVIATAVLLIVVLATYNVVSADQSESEVTTAEAMLGLSPVTIADAYEASF